MTFPDMTFPDMTFPDMTFPAAPITLHRPPSCPPKENARVRSQQQ